MKTSTLSLFLLSLWIASYARLSGADGGDADLPSVVRELLDRHCVSCHGETQREAELRLDQVDADVAGQHETWNAVRFKMVVGEMPPPERARPDRVRQQRVIDWIANQLRAAGITPIEPEGFFLPKNGNKVDHDRLFDGSIHGPAATRSRLWRVGPHVYESLMKGEVGKGVKGLSQPFGHLTSPGLKDYAAAFTIDEPTTGQLIRNAEAIVASQTRGERVDCKWIAKGYPQPVKEFIALLDPANQPVDESLKTRAVAKQFQLILRREPTAEEAKRYVALMDQTTADAGRLLGVRTALAAVLVSPEAVFRFELGDGARDQHGRRMLSPRELAFAISFALTDRAPTDDLLRAAAEGRLATKADVAREAKHIFNHPKIAKPRIMRFFREYFGFRAATEVFKDKELNPHHRADVLVADTEQLIEWILRRDKDVFRELMTTNKAFVNFRLDPKKGPVPAQPKNLIHTSYGLPMDWKWTPYQPIDLPSNERAGILTQPSWLVANSGNFDNHPILRGKWIREHLLGGTIPELPITVDAQLPDEPEHTLRHRMRVTREAYCWNCHQQMNPLGLTFEIYDHFGRYRTLENVLDSQATRKNVDSKGRPRGPIMRRVDVDASGRVDGPGLAAAREHDDAVSMIRDLAESERARQMFVRYAFRYFLGRNEELSDSPTLMAADRHYVESGGSFRRLVESLITSDSFLYRFDFENEQAPQ